MDEALQPAFGIAQKFCDTVKDTISGLDDATLTTLSPDELKKANEIVQELVKSYSKENSALRDSLARIRMDDRVLRESPVPSSYLSMSSDLKKCAGQLRVIERKIEYSLAEAPSWDLPKGVSDMLEGHQYGMGGIFERYQYDCRCVAARASWMEQHQEAYPALPRYPQIPISDQLVWGFGNLDTDAVPGNARFLLDPMAFHEVSLEWQIFIYILRELTYKEMGCKHFVVRLIDDVRSKVEQLAPELKVAADEYRAFFGEPEGRDLDRKIDAFLQVMDAEDASKVHGKEFGELLKTMGERLEQLQKRKQEFEDLCKDIASNI